MVLCCAHDKDWDVKEEMQGRDVDDETIAKLSAFRITCSGRQLTSVVEPQALTCYLTETDESSHLICLTLPCAVVFLLLCVVPNLFYYRSMRAPEGPVADPGRRQGEGLKKDVLGTRPGNLSGNLSIHSVPKS